MPPTIIGTTTEGDDHKSTPSMYDIMERKSTNGVDQQEPKQQQQQGTASPFLAEAPTMKFRDIVGHRDAKLRLEEALLPLALQTLPPQVLVGIRGGSLSGILLHGPPGTGKTMLAHALAGEVGASFLSVSPADILSKYVGESEKSIQHLFMVAKHEARQNRHGCILFLDEIDALGQSRISHNTTFSTPVNTYNPSGTRVLAELLIQISNLSKEQQQQYRPPQRTNQKKHERSAEVTVKYKNEKYPRQQQDFILCRQQQEKEHYDCDREPQCKHFHTTTSYATMTELIASSFSVPKTDSLTEERLPPPFLTLRQLHAEVENTNPSPSMLSTPSPTAASAGIVTGGRVILIAATNRPADCDPALLRRFTVRVLIDVPTQRDRCRMIQRFLRDIHHIVTKSDIQQISNATDGFSGSDLESFSREAIMAPIRDCLKDAATLKRKARREYHKSSQQTIHKKMRHRKKSSPRTNQEKGPSLTTENAAINTSASTIRFNVLDSATTANINNYQVPTSSKMNPNDIAREHLLLGLQELRPVTLKDFENAYTFWLGGGEKTDYHCSANTTANANVFTNDNNEERFQASSIHTNELNMAMGPAKCAKKDEYCCNTTTPTSSEDDDTSSYSTSE
jgi:SpoVK/Ycf46/Vps4 family AAA+-type ATPase